MTQPRRSVFLLLLIALAFQAQDLIAQKRPIKLMDAFGNRDLMPDRSAPIQWMRDGKSYSRVKKDSTGPALNIVRGDAATGKEQVLVDKDALKPFATADPLPFVAYEWSDDEAFIVFTLAQKSIWRRSTTGEYAVYSMKDKRLTLLPKHESGMRNVKVSPDGTRVGYVLEDNIWVYDLRTGGVTQLTNDAEENVYNGRFGWVYEEEFSLVDGWLWSADGRRIAYWHEDERGVPEYTLTDWNSVHPELTRIRYPKPGDPNPIERIGVIDVETKKTVWMDLGAEADVYIPNMLWTSDPETLCIFKLNRNQNHLRVLFADANTGATRVVLEESSTTGWIEIEEGQTLGSYMKFLGKKKQFLFASERDGWCHIYLYDLKGTLVNKVTEGNFDVNRIAGISPDEQTLYYLSTEASPTEQHLYSVKLDGTKKQRMTTEEGWHIVNMSPTCALYVDSWSSINRPPVSKLLTTDGTVVRTLAETKPDKYKSYQWSDKELLTLTTQDGLTLHCSMIKPPNFDPAKKYPVYFDVYGGPGSPPTVRNSWPQTVHQWIANEGFIVFQIDNRGTSGRGTAFKHAVYMQLGKWEVNDYVEGAKYLAGLPYVDKDNMGIWGWSYGGYISALTLLLGADHFKAAVAIAPVTDYRLYDTIYTERFMRTPQENPDGYKNGSCVENADKLKGKLLVIHGGQDDNVHLQNTMQFIAKLNEAGKQYDMRIFPNGNHGIANGMKERIALYEYFMNFMKANLQGS